MSEPIVLPPSVLGRLVESLHWDGPGGTRGGGQGWEKVLTAEVFQALDWLPRILFLGEVLRGAVGATDTVVQLANDVEKLAFELNPGNYYLADQPPPGCLPMPVQPDGIMVSPSVFCMVETKRIKDGRFNPRQLTKEFLAVVRHAEDAGKVPLLLLVVPEGPSVRMREPSRRTRIDDEIVDQLKEVLDCSEPGLGTTSDLAARIDSVVAYTTWANIGNVASDGSRRVDTGDPSIDASVRRLATAVNVAIKWHGLHPQG